MTDDAQQLRSRLKRLGLTDAAVAAAWPRWWTEDAESSASARTELRFGVARRLGLDPRSLFDTAGPRFTWKDEARFKHLSGENELERAGITSFGEAVATVAVSALAAEATVLPLGSAGELRTELLAGRPYVELIDLLTLAWSVGMPVLHLRVFPWPQKRMAAMAVAAGHTYAVLVGKDSTYPATIAFYVAHELGHVALGHIAPGRQIVDLEDEGPIEADRDAEDQAADAFALELLTGDPRPTVLPEDPRNVSAAELARVATNSANALGIEAGTIVLSFGYSTGNWAAATAALERIYPGGQPVWRQVNGIARRQLSISELPHDAADFLRIVLGDNADA